MNLNILKDMLTPAAKRNNRFVIADQVAKAKMAEPQTLRKNGRSTPPSRPPKYSDESLPRTIQTAILHDGLGKQRRKDDSLTAGVNARSSEAQANKEPITEVIWEILDPRAPGPRSEAVAEPIHGEWKQLRKSHNKGSPMQPATEIEEAQGKRVSNKLGGVVSADRPRLQRQGSYDLQSGARWVVDQISEETDATKMNSRTSPLIEGAGNAQSHQPTLISSLGSSNTEQMRSNHSHCSSGMTAPPRAKDMDPHVAPITGKHRQPWEIPRRKDVAAELP